MANFPAMSLRHPMAVIILMIMAMSQVWSRALLSITAGFLLFVTITEIRINPFRIRWLLTPSIIVQSIRNKPVLWVFALYFFLYLVSIVYAGDLSEWWKLTHMKLPFLILPLSFALLGSFTRKEYMLITVCMLVTAVWSTIWVQVAYYSDFYILSKSLGFGGSLPTPINHIRYSVVIAMSLVVCTAFVIDNWKIKYDWERWAYGGMAIYLFYFLHVLSVRSGLALGYAGVFILVIFYMQRVKRWKQLVMIAILIAAPFIAYKILPGFEQKVNYTIYDLGQFKSGKGDDYSDSERWQSWRAGIELGNKHPIVGTGTGNFRTELEDYYKTKLQKDSFARPHNQWINVYAIFGLVGLIIFIFVLLYPMTFSFFWKPPLMPALYIMQLISMAVEHPLDTTFGTSLFLLLTLIGISYQTGKKEGIN